MTSILAASGVAELGRDVPLLTLLVLIPALGALVVGLMSVLKTTDGVAKMTGVGFSLVTTVLAALLLVAFDRHNADFQFVSQHEWLPALGINWKLGVDGISLFLVALSGVLFPLALLGPRVTENVKAYVAWLLLLEAGCIGSFLSLDLFLFFVFFEAVLVPMYFLIARWGYARRSYAALKFFLYTLAGSAFLLVGTLALVFITASNTDQRVTFDFVALQQQQAFSSGQGRWLFVAFAIAFAVKIPIFPLHTWLPDTYEQSPIAGVVVSAGVMVKLGTYGLMRFGVSLFPKAAEDLAPVLLTLAVIGMVYGALVAAVQHDLKRLVAYASLSHLGFIVLGTFSLSDKGWSGAVAQMVNHGLSTAALFLLLGMIYSRRSTTKIAQLRGLQKSAPVMAAVFTLVMLSVIGVPGLNGFVGEFTILLGTFLTHRWWAVAGAAALIIAAVYMLWAYQRVFHGEPGTKDEEFGDMTSRERWIMAPLVILIVFLGVYPKPVFDRIEPSVDRILQSPAGPAKGADVRLGPAPAGPPPSTVVEGSPN